MTNVYVEPVRADFWQLAKEPGEPTYIDPLGAKDCMTHSAAREVMRTCEGIRPAGTTGVWPPTGYAIRRACIDPATGKADTSGGVNHGQIQRAVKRLYNVDLTLYYGNSFDDMVDLSVATHGVMVSLFYQRIRDTPSRRGSFSFTGNHEFFISNADTARSVFKGVVDPLADGRQAGLFRGPGEYSFALIKAAMGDLNISATSTYRRLGLGKGYFAIGRATGAPPATDLRRVAITGYTPLYDAPGGQRDGAVRLASYICERSKPGGLWWYRILTKANGAATASRGLWFKPNANTEAHYT